MSEFACSTLSFATLSTYKEHGYMQRTYLFLIQMVIGDCGDEFDPTNLSKRGPSSALRMMRLYRYRAGSIRFSGVNRI